MSDLAIVTFNDVPAVNHSLKYEVLGRMAVETEHDGSFMTHLIARGRW